MKPYLVYFVGVLSAIDEQTAVRHAKSFLERHQLHQLSFYKVAKQDLGFPFCRLNLNEKGVS